MIVQAKFSALREGNWREYAARFALGGLATVLAGGVAQIFGPEVGGLFLAFPAIFCASATLIEKHERRRKTDKNYKARSAARTLRPSTRPGQALVVPHVPFSVW